MPAGHVTIKGQMLISCILARSLRASPHTVPNTLPIRAVSAEKKVLFSPLAATQALTQQANC